jgi:hypothetical protein
MRWSLPPLLHGLPRRAKSLYVCAWCRRNIGPHQGRLQGEPTVKYGLCESCLQERLSQLSGEAAHRNAAGSGSQDQLLA